jgi:LacI family transcriptional regulator
MPRITRRKTIRAATLADVGRMAGVSAMAASAVLNGARTSSRISVETRARIMEAAGKLRYRPNVAARALANRRMNTIGVAAVVDEGTLNYYFLEVFNGIIEGAAKYGQNTTVFVLHDWTKEISKVAGFCDGRIDGLILLGPVISREMGPLLPEHTHFTALHPNVLLPNFTSIESDEEKGAWELVSHLVSLGHRRILHLSGQRNLLGAERRIAGYRKALSDAGIPFDPALIAEAGYSVEAGKVTMEAWLDAHIGQPLPTAIFCANDSSAAGCLETLASRGLRVPTDVSLCGFDDSLAARTCVPQLTTERQPLRQMGLQAVASLMEQIKYSSNTDASAVQGESHIVFPTQLAVRDSTAAPGPEKLIEARA